MKLLISVSSVSNGEAVKSINAKLGTNFTVFDYHAWESGEDNAGTRKFAKAVEKYVGSPSYRIVTFLAIMSNKIKNRFK